MSGCVFREKLRLAHAGKHAGLLFLASHIASAAVPASHPLEPVPSEANWTNRGSGHDEAELGVLSAHRPRARRVLALQATVRKPLLYPAELRGRPTGRNRSVAEECVRERRAETGSGPLTEASGPLG